MSDKKRALITGGSRGIGKACALMLAKSGYDILLNYKNNEDAAKNTKAEVEKHGVSCKLMQFDVADFDNVKKSIEDEINASGVIDVLIFNAGIRKDGLFPIMGKSDWDSVIDINLKSFYYVTQPVVKAMFGKGHGRIVVISSTAGLTGMAGQVNYACTKFGLIGAAKSLSLEVARKNITVNVVAPGFVDTDIIADIKDRVNDIVKTIPARRIGTVEDVANVVEFLVSEKSSYIIGQVIAVNGGVLT